MKMDDMRQEARELKIGNIAYDVGLAVSDGQTPRLGPGEPSSDKTIDVLGQKRLTYTSLAIEPIPFKEFLQPHISSA